MDTDFIKLALGDLDHQNDEHWTADGLPRVDVIRQLTADDSITRQDITNAAPKFAREEKAPRPKEEKEEVLPSLEEAEAAVREAKETLDLAKMEYDRARREADKIRLRMEGTPEDRRKRVTKQCRDYIERSNQERRAEYERRKQISEAMGVKFEFTPSKLDQALRSRKRQSGV